MCVGVFFSFVDFNKIIHPKKGTFLFSFGSHIISQITNDISLLFMSTASRKPELFSIL